MRHRHRAVGSPGNGHKIENLRTAADEVRVYHVNSAVFWSILFATCQNVWSRNLQHAIVCCTTARVARCMASKADTKRHSRHRANLGGPLCYISMLYFAFTVAAWV
jgi:hypothetical protein